MFEYERPLLIRVALDTGLVDTDGQLGLLGLETAMSVVTVAAFHRALHDLVAERLCELRLLLVVAT